MISFADPWTGSSRRRDRSAAAAVAEQAVEEQRHQSQRIVEDQLLGERRVGEASASRFSRTRWRIALVGQLLGELGKPLGRQEQQRVLVEQLEEVGRPARSGTRRTRSGSSKSRRQLGEQVGEVLQLVGAALLRRPRAARSGSRSNRNRSSASLNVSTWRLPSGSAPGCSTPAQLGAQPDPADQEQANEKHQAVVLTAEALDTQEQEPVLASELGLVGRRGHHGAPAQRTPPGSVRHASRDYFVPDRSRRQARPPSGARFRARRSPPHAILRPRLNQRRPHPSAVRTRAA